MKKVLALSVFAVLGVAALSSCKKDYSCMYDGEEISKCTGCTKSQETAFKSACSLSGGTVEKK